MNIFQLIWDYILHLDINLHNLVIDSPVLSYFLLFFVTYMETAGVVTVFLPSDTVVLTACSLAVVQNTFSLPLLFVIFISAAFLGDSTNFAIGRALRKEINKKGHIFFIKEKTFNKSKELFQRSGTAAVVGGRFVPILRSMAPFVSGISQNTYRWFVKRNVIAVTLWTTFYFSLGVFFGNMDFVKNHFAYIVIGIACVTIIAAILSITIKSLFLSKKKADK